MNKRRLEIQTKPFIYTIPAWIQKIADPYNIEFRVSEKPSEAGIMEVDDLPTYKKSPAVYIEGTGVVWVRKTQTFKRKCDADFMLLHELGHAFMDMIKWKKEVTAKQHEIMANAIALTLIIMNKKPLSNAMLHNISNYPTVRSLFVRPRGIFQKNKVKRVKARGAK